MDLIPDTIRNVIIASDFFAELLVKTEGMSLEELQALERDIMRWIDPHDGYAFDFLAAYRQYIARLINDRKGD